MNKFKILFLSFVLVQLLPAHLVLADTGPKPTMDFEFKQDSSGEETTIISGTLYECDWSDCRDAAPLEELGPQGLYCDLESCHAIGYGFAPYHILEIEFSDEVTRRSNIFETGGFNSSYSVTIQQDSMFVKEKIHLGIVGSVALLLACICILGVGLIAGLSVFLIRRSSKK